MTEEDKQDSSYPQNKRQMNMTSPFKAAIKSSIIPKQGDQGHKKAGHC